MKINELYSFKIGFGFGIQGDAIELYQSLSQKRGIMVIGAKQ